MKENKMNVVWRKEWIQNYETPWSIFEKLSLANRVERNQLLRTLGNESVKNIKNAIGDSKRELMDLTGFDRAYLLKVLDYDLVEHNKVAITTIAEPISHFSDRQDLCFSKNLRWCEECLKLGLHSWFHQFVYLRTCPYHGISLTEACPKCKQTIPFILSDKRLSTPFTCKCEYQLADFSVLGWRTWDIRLNIESKEVTKWISKEWREVQKLNRWIFIPNHVSINILTEESPTFSLRNSPSRHNAVETNYLKSMEFGKIIFEENKATYLSIERYINKNLLCNHKHCVDSLLHLKKNEEGEFPPICPYAYAYVFWRRSLLKLDQFYKRNQNSEIVSPSLFGVEFATQLINDELVYLKELFITHIRKSTNIDPTALIWMLNRTTAAFCLTFYYKWLDISVEGAKNLTVPSWKEIMVMKELCIPKFAFKINMQKKLEVDVITEKSANQTLPQYDCPRKSRANRMAARNMKSHTPLEVAIKVSRNPDEAIKQLQAYVDHYIARLSF